MQWRSTITKPVNQGYYLCAIIGNSKPRELYWDGSMWSYVVEYDGWHEIGNDEVLYYMNLDNIPMPDDWTKIDEVYPTK